VLLDEIAAHLDESRRAALFDELETLPGQVWMTGADAGAFAPLGARAQVLHVTPGTARSGSVPPP
jgi:DNA replication and repair protein RecF